MKSSLKFLVIALLVVAFFATAAIAQDQVKNTKQNKDNSKKTPRFLIIVSEQNVGGTISAWWSKGEEAAQGIAAANLGLVENVFVDVFRSSGHQVIDHQVLQGSVTIPKPLQVLKPGNKSVSKIGNLFGADYVVVGSAIATTTAEVGGGIKSAHATINVRIVSTKTAEIVASAAQDVDAINANPQAAGSAALKKGAEKLAQKLIKAINSKPGIKAFVFE